MNQGEDTSSNFSLLDLDNLILIKIIGYLDCFCLRSVLLSCQRLYYLACDRSTWSVLALRKRILHLLLLCHAHDSADKYQIRVGVNQLLRDSILLLDTSRALRKSEVDRIWAALGPVAGKLFSCLSKVYTKQRVVYEDDRPDRVVFCHYSVYGLRSGRNLQLSFQRLTDINCQPTGFESVGQIVVSCGTSLKIFYKKRKQSADFEEDLQNLFGSSFFAAKKIVCHDVKCLMPLIEILQDEFGSTEPPISLEFLKGYLEYLSSNQNCFFQKCYFQAPVLNEPVNYKSLQSTFSTRKRALTNHCAESMRQAFFRLGTVGASFEEWKDLVDCLIQLAIKFGRYHLRKLEIAINILDRAHSWYLHMSLGTILVNQILKKIDFESIKWDFGDLKLMQGKLLGKSNVSITFSFDFNTSKDTSVNIAVLPSDSNTQQIVFAVPDNERITIIPMNIPGVASYIDARQLQPVTELLRGSLLVDSECSEDLGSLTNRSVAYFFLSILEDVPLSKVFVHCLPFLMDENVDTSEVSASEDNFCVRSCMSHECLVGGDERNEDKNKCLCC